MRLFVLGLVLCLLGSNEGSASEISQDAGPACSAAGQPANLGFILVDKDGNDHDLSKHAGKVILLDFWATWCAPCRIEIPGFIKLYDALESEGLSVIGISVNDSVEAIRRFASEFQMDYPVLVGDGRDDVKAAFGPMVGFPTTVIITREGLICHHHTGFTPAPVFEAEIRALL